MLVFPVAVPPAPPIEASTIAGAFAPLVATTAVFESVAMTLPPTPPASVCIRPAVVPPRDSRVTPERPAAPPSERR
ncbi:MAG: hypothetical protein B7Z15_10480 [Rhizobiales bacterium 32-66-8]|nr:MAG: hypothetical protein B7Z15_10480 [Rhizobiales bacterium 32-66-8]